MEKKNNILPLWGSERTMNLNPLILTNIQSSHYFKVNLYELKTYHEVIDEIYYKVTHLEPWEKGSRKTSGQTGMCGGVRGVGAGGIVSTAFCLLYKLFTIKLTRKQVNGLIMHHDSPYIRALGFMYIRYTQPPSDLWDWFDSFLEDPEELDVKAGGGQVMTIGEMLRHFLTKLEWFSTLFPRIPVPIQQGIEKKLSERFPNLFVRGRPGPKIIRTPAVPVARSSPTGRGDGGGERGRHGVPDGEVSFGEAERAAQQQRSGGKENKGRGGGGGGERDRERDRERERDRMGRGERDREKARDSRSRSQDKGGHHRHSGDKDRHHHRSPPRDFAEELAREKERQRKEKEKDGRKKSSKDKERGKERKKERKDKHRSGSRDRDRRR